MVERLMELLNVGEEGVLYLLLAVGVVCIGLIIERTVVIVRAKGSLAKYKETLSGFLAKKNYDGAYNYFSSQNTAQANIISAALGSMNRAPEAIQETVDGVVIELRMKLERGLDFLGSVGSNAPFVGLFGTVLGIIHAFHALAKAQTAEPQVVMAGISVALIATAVGLGVAIPALVAYNFFKGATRDILRSADAMVKMVMSESLDHALGRPVQKTEKAAAATQN